MDPLTAGFALAKLVPGLIDLFKGDDKDAPLAEKIVGIAKTVTGLDKPDDMLAAISKDPALLVQFKAQAAQVAIEELRAETEQLKTINETMRVEYASGSMFKSGWRPYIGWIFGTAFGLQMFAASAIIFFKPEQAKNVLEGLATLGTLWFVALTVLGVNINKRSQDKQAAAGIEPPIGIFGALTQRIAGKT